MFPAHARRSKWGPSAEMWHFQDEINRLFSGFASHVASTDFPFVNIWVSESSIVITAEVPGVAPDDLELIVREGTLTLSGERKRPAVADEASWHRRERTYGPFSRVIRLPFLIDVGKVKAFSSYGVLEVELQRPEADKPRRIDIATK